MLKLWNGCFDIRLEFLLHDLFRASFIDHISVSFIMILMVLNLKFLCNAVSVRAVPPERRWCALMALPPLWVTEAAVQEGIGDEEKKGDVSASSSPNGR